MVMHLPNAMSFFTADGRHSEANTWRLTFAQQQQLKQQKQQLIVQQQQKQQQQQQGQHTVLQNEGSHRASELQRRH